MTGFWWMAIGAAVTVGLLLIVSRVGRTTIEAAEAEPAYTVRTEQDESFLTGDFGASQRAGYVEPLDAYRARMRDTNYGTARDARDRFNAQQGDPQ